MLPAALLPLRKRATFQSTEADPAPPSPTRRSVQNDRVFSN